ncbi:MAG: hypothetical protein IT211_06745 [Armatimonadetes bacterium]|nr:hypothetical protein [Armatimonadota bacterium]
MKTILRCFGVVTVAAMLIVSTMMAGNAWPGYVNAPGGATKGKGRWIKDETHAGFIRVFCDTAYPTEQCWCIDGGTLYTGQLTAGHNPSGGELIAPTVDVYN